MFDFLRRYHSPFKITNLNTSFYKNASVLKGIIPGKDFKRPTSKGGTVYVIDFVGDIMATQANALSKEITAILAVARKERGDEVLVRLESPGGAVHGYGYAASQLSRIKNADIPLTIAVDKVAASGGYMMAVIADKIIAAPFAIIGSVGVVAEFPNFSGLLEKLGVAYKQYTAGEYKRTVSQMGPITEEAENKFRDELKRTHVLFKSHIKNNRKKVDVDSISTGEHWYGIDAMDKKLIDQIGTSEDYILSLMVNKEVVHIKYDPPKNFGESFKVSMVKLFKSVVIEALSLSQHLKL